ncbi:MAG: PAS domain-containing protein, partial [Spirochaetales bacterium]|nr:PAS domain-containing protein [Spirochaetales bacterium]
MSQFVKKASSKIEKLSDEEILRIIDSQNAELRIRNLILDNLIAGCLMVSPQGNILYMNSALKELTALSERKKYTDVNVSRV